MINEVRLIGNVGQDPRINTNNRGTMASFSVATVDKWKDKNTGDWVERTEWHRCIAFNYPAEYIERNIEKGDLVYIEGSMQYGKYEKNGVDIPTAEVKVQKIKLLKKPDGKTSSNDTRHEDRGGYPSTGDDVPF